MASYVAGYLWLTGELEERLLWGVGLPDDKDDKKQEAARPTTAHPANGTVTRLQHYHHKKYSQRRRRG